MSKKTVADNQEEMLHYFDAEGNKLGTLSRKEIHAKGLINEHDAFYVTNSFNEILLQLRSKDKKVNADQWDKPGGHVTAGENSSGKEFIEEVCHNIRGIDYRIVPLDEFNVVVESTDTAKTAVLAKVETIPNYQARRVHSDGSIRIEPILLNIYIGRYDGPVAPQPGEVQKLEYFGRKKMEKLIATHPNKLGNDTKDILEMYGGAIFQPEIMGRRTGKKI